jgi:hypothetical protein
MTRFGDIHMDLTKFVLSRLTSSMDFQSRGGSTTDLPIRSEFRRFITI